jgi:hypothetical protein
MLSIVTSLATIVAYRYLRFHRSDLRAYIDAKRAESGRQPRRR